MAKRKCCGTPKGSGPHAPGCQQESSLRSGPKEARKAVFLEVAEDLPDGAFWAMAQEFGLEPDDFVDEGV